MKSAALKNCFRIVQFLFNESKFNFGDFQQLSEYVIFNWKSFESIKNLIHWDELSLDSVCFYSIQRGKLEVMKYLIGKELEISHNVLWYSCSYGCLESLKWLVEESTLNLDLNSEIKYRSQTLLYTAASNGHLKIVEFLIEKKVDLNKQNSYNTETALFGATRGNHIEVIQCLVDAGADLNQTNANGESCLLVASAFGRLEAIKCLVSNGASLHLADSERQTPLFRACEFSHFDVVQFLVEKGSDLNQTNVNGKSLLAIATKPEIVQYLIEKDAQSISNKSYF